MTLKSSNTGDLLIMLFLFMDGDSIKIISNSIGRLLIVGISSGDKGEELTSLWDLMLWALRVMLSLLKLV
jgi:hypothetical protein